MTEFSVRFARAKAAERVLLASEWAFEHARQVERLACWLFAVLREFHGYGPDEEVLLCTAALVHDIGYPVDPARHHKVSARIIRAHLGPPFSDEQVALVALLARYHRKGLPKLRHRRYAKLDLHERRLVNWLAGILRVADGLDRAHDSTVQWLNAAIADGRLEIRVGDYTRPDSAPNSSIVLPAANFSHSNGCGPDSYVSPLAVNVAGAMRKRRLLERALGMPVVIQQA